MQKIIDISHYQEVTSWAQIAKNVDAVILKATQGRGLTSNAYLFTDSKFHEFAKAAIANRIPLGAYHFFTGSTEADAVKEADYFCEVLAPYRDKLMFAVCDAENYGNRWLLGLSRSQFTANINAFCARVESHGITAVNYTNVDHINSYINARDIPYPCWCASYGSRKPTVPGGNLIAWQYTSEGRVPGISNNVDMNHGYFSDAVFAIYRLQAAGVINTPKYWYEHHSDVRYLDEFLIKAADKVKGIRDAEDVVPYKVGTLSFEAALGRLEAAGVVNTPEYWRANADKVKYLPELICKLGGAV